MWLILDRPGLRLDYERAALRVREPRMPGSVHLSAAAGQWTHLGKNASFGLGRYRLETPALTGPKEAAQNSYGAKPAVSGNPRAKSLNQRADFEVCF